MDNSDKEIQNLFERKFKALQSKIENSDQKIHILEEMLGDLRNETETGHKDSQRIFKEECKKIQRGTKKTQDEIIGVSNKGFQKLEKDHKETKTVLKSELEKLKVDLKNHLKQNDDFFRSGGCYMLLTLNILLVIAVTVFSSSSTHISEDTPCELKKALDSIHLNYTSQVCKHDSIMEMSGQLSGWGKVEFWLTSISALFIAVCIYISRLKNRMFRVLQLFLYVILALIPLIFFIANIKMYVEFEHKEKKHADIDYGNLQVSMLSWLGQHYKTDNISSSDTISNGWNNLFIKYDCCAVREVQGTSNDFDNTPWCTSSGSCQQTSSQIPKTCCKDVTKDTYPSASSSCHASVSPGTFKPSCISRIRGLSVVDIDECQVTMISRSLLIMLVLQMFEVILTIALLLCGLLRHRRLKKAENAE